MAFYRRHLPHLYAVGSPVFVTWRLHGSLPPGRHFDRKGLTSGEAFVTMDRLLDQATLGPLYLRRPEIAAVVTEAIYFNRGQLAHYTLHSFVVMPNHVHLLATPLVALPKMMKSLKSITAKRANSILHLTGRPFWQEESYDRLVRDEQEFERVRSYIENNPVRAGLVRRAEEFQWSSAKGADRGVATATVE
jgi:putative transposase